MRKVRDLWAALAGGLQHGDDCACRWCARETAQSDAGDKAHVDADDRKVRSRRKARRVVRAFARKYGHAISDALRASEWYVAGAWVYGRDALDAFRVALPYGPGAALVVSVEHTQGGSEDDPDDGCDDDDE